MVLLFLLLDILAGSQIQLPAFLIQDGDETLFCMSEKYSRLYDTFEDLIRIQ